MENKSHNHGPALGKQITQSWTRNRKENKPHSHGPSIGKEITVMDSRWERTQITQAWTSIEKEYKPHSYGPPIGKQITHKMFTHLYTEMENLRPKFKMSTNSAACLYIPLYIGSDSK